MRLGASPACFRLGTDGGAGAGGTPHYVAFAHGEDPSVNGTLSFPLPVLASRQIGWRLTGRYQPGVSFVGPLRLIINSDSAAKYDWTQKEWLTSSPGITGTTGAGDTRIPLAAGLLANGDEVFFAFDVFPGSAATKARALGFATFGNGAVERRCDIAGHYTDAGATVLTNLTIGAGFGAIVGDVFQIMGFA